ncbi:MAG TPA: MFS transporter [Roseiarcus sp.]|nr:MFS transporter [Roseiarcus sp.]
MKLFALSPRRAVAATFAAFGVSLGAWSGASAAIVARVGVSATEFGVALTIFTVLYLAAMSGAGALAERIGARRALLAALLATGPALALIFAARSGLWLGLGLALYGLIGGLTDSTMNAEGARVEQSGSKPIFVQFHAMASAGMAVGAAAGGWLAFHGLAWSAALLAEASLLAAALAVARALADRRYEAPRRAAGPRWRRLDLGLAVLGLAVGVSIVCETSAMAWGALLLRKSAPSLAAYAGLGAAFFAGCQSVMRFQVDRLRRAVNDRALMLASYAVAATGLALVAADLGFGFSAAGFAVLGAGTAAIVPCGFSLAARRPGLSAGLAISAVSFFGLAPRAPAPLLTGLIADALSLSAAFAGLAALMLLAMLGVALFVPRAQRAFPKSQPYGGLAP